MEDVLLDAYTICLIHPGPHFMLCADQIQPANLTHDIIDNPI
jgi:hypothetical protein